MKQTVNEYQFRKAFKECRPNQFSWEGLHALFNWFEEYETETETEIELDIIGICCEWSEYTNLKEFQNDYGIKYTLAEIGENTIYIPIENSESFIIQQF